MDMDFFLSYHALVYIFPHICPLTSCTTYG